jgi:hypothetical protein
MNRATAAALLASLFGVGNSPTTLAHQHPTTQVTPRGLPESLTIRGAHSVTIRRRVADPALRRALEVAERTDPPRDSVLAAASDLRVGLRGTATESRLWWSSEFDGVRIPYAITDAAVAYYIALSDTLRRGRTPGGRGVSMLRSNFEYVATVERHDRFVLRGATYSDVYVVRLRLAWSNYCGDLCALSFGAARTVLVGDDGGVRAVAGDGPTPAVVS